MVPSEKGVKPSEKADFVYPSGFRLALLMVSIFISMFLVALVGIKAVAYLTKLTRIFRTNS